MSIAAAFTAAAFAAAFPPAAKHGSPVNNAKAVEPVSPEIERRVIADKPILDRGRR